MCLCKKNETLEYSTSNKLVAVPVPYFNQTFKSKFSITTQQKLKFNIYSDRINLVLSESYLTFNFCRVVFENFDFKV